MLARCCGDLQLEVELKPEAEEDDGDDLGGGEEREDVGGSNFDISQKLQGRANVPKRNLCHITWSGESSWR